MNKSEEKKIKSYINKIGRLKRNKYGHIVIYRDLYICDYSSKNFLSFLMKHDIKHFECLPFSENKVASIGFSESEKKWYGWSHRAIYGFGIGYIAKEGDCCTSSGWTDDFLIQNPERNLSVPVGFEVKSLEDAKKVAIAFAESVSELKKNMNMQYNEIVHYIYCKYDDVDKCLSPFCNEKTCQHVMFQCDVRQKKKKKTIHLILKHKWFDMINDGIKKEEYREITKRYEKMFKEATHVIFHKGYSNVTCERRIVRIVKGCGNEEWGAEHNKEYFIIIITKIK